MDTDVYYDIPIFHSKYSYIPEKNNSYKKDLVNISIDDIYQIEPFNNINNETEDRSIHFPNQKKNFLLLLLLFIFILLLNYF